MLPLKLDRLRFEDLFHVVLETGHFKKRYRVPFETELRRHCVRAVAAAEYCDFFRCHKKSSFGCAELFIFHYILPLLAVLVK